MRGDQARNESLRHVTHRSGSHSSRVIASARTSIRGGFGGRSTVAWSRVLHAVWVVMDSPSVHGASRFALSTHTADHAAARAATRDKSNNLELLEKRSRLV